MFDVRWTEEATAELLRIWPDAHPEDRSLITDAVHETDMILAGAVDEVGESREEDFRILVMPGIAVQYRVRRDDRRVPVANVWRTFPTRPRDETESCCSPGGKVVAADAC